MFTPLVVIAIVVVVLLVMLVGTYNRLVALRQNANNAFADIDVQLKQRQDLVPNLVETVKGYAAHERGTLDEVTAARAQAASANTVEGKVQAENALSGALGRLFAVAEAYPELKANQNFLDLQNQLTDTENKIQAARRFYNGNVRDLNVKIQSFPGNVIAGMFHFAKMDFFQLDASDAAAREPVAVQF